MKKIQKERKSYYDVFVAADGTEFTTSDECKKYEESAKGVVLAKIKPLVVDDITEEDILGFGSCEYTMWVVKPTTQEDVDTLMQAYLLANPHMTQDDNKGFLEDAIKLVQRSLDENDVIFVGRGYGMDGFWFYGTRNSFKEKLDTFMPAEKNNDNA